MPTPMNKKLITVLLVAFILSLSIVLIGFGPIKQDISYHNFSDTRELFGVANFYNVVSNLGFLVVGVLGLYTIFARQTRQTRQTVDELAAAYLLLFAGVTLVALGSFYYHLDPNNQTLLWDRLPMTIAFMAVFSIVISEVIAVQLGRLLLLPLIVLGVLSVLYWYVTEQQGAGDLRFYALVQFFPLLAITLMLIAASCQHRDVRGYWWLISAYVTAKVAEFFDDKVFQLLGFLSGHSLKHILVAVGLYMLLRHYQSRDRAVH